MLMFIISYLKTISLVLKIAPKVVINYHTTKKSINFINKTVFFAFITTFCIVYR